MLLNVLFLIAFAHAIDPVLIERAKLAFIERTVVQVLSKGTFPEMFGAETQVLVNCGCSHSPMPIYWGSKVGMLCKLTNPGYAPGCGQRCTTPYGDDILLLCPAGWAQDCNLGCVPPQFDTTVQRVQFLENTVDMIGRWGYDYALIQPDYLKTCACAEGSYRHITYGTKLGYDCIIKGDPQEGCKAWGPCEDYQGNAIQVFCSAGYAPSCSGCQKGIDFGTDLDTRLDWAIDAMTGYVLESEAALDLTPTQLDVVNCGCIDMIEKVRYGNGIGWYCHIDQNGVNDMCEFDNAICRDSDGRDLIHFCPDGFLANCEVGCGHWWKLEL